MKPIHALFCDLDDTLADDTGSNRISLSRITPRLKQAKPDLLDVEIQAVFRTVMVKHWENFDDSPIKAMPDPQDVYILLWDEILHTWGIQNPKLSKELARDFLTYRDESYTVFDDSLAALERLQEKMPVILVSNGHAVLQRKKIAICNMAPLIQKTVIAQEFGLSKPRKEIFHEAMKSVQVPAEQILMVGDNPVADIQGGKNAGLQTAWIQRRPHYAFSHDPNPDYYVQSMIEVEAWIQKSQE
jgi:HAD superfamily hydrolase (TIGR01549 family)